jgi:hypothetical protein
MDTARVPGSEPARAPASDSPPHDITLAVWGIPDATPAGERFAVKVGAKSSAALQLGGGRIALRDSAGAVVASSALGGSPWPGTSALFWANVELQAPTVAGVLALSAHFDAAELDPPHRGAAFAFNVTVVEPPAYTLTVKVIEKKTAAPVEDAQVRLGPHRATTGASGLAEMRIANCRRELHVWKAGYDALVTAVEIDGDTFVQVEVTAVAEEDPDARWTG